MSRSRKKFPIHGIACHKPAMLKKDKNLANRKVRRSDLDDICSGNYYKRLDDNWTWCNDGKTWNPDWPKAWRK